MVQISEPKQLLEHELGMALGAEREVLTSPRKLEKSAQRQELKQQFHQHLEETEGQIKNIEQAFQALGARGRARPRSLVGRPYPSRSRAAGRAPARGGP